MSLKRRLKIAFGIGDTEEQAEQAQQLYDARQAWGAMSPAEQKENRAWAERVCDEDKKRNPGAYK